MREPRRLVVLSLLTVAVAAFSTYAGVLRYGFTASDTLPLIQTGRLESWGDLARILTDPLMGGTSFVGRALLYRPLSTLSFGLDHAVWGLDPFGYHLTDLLLHVIAACLVMLSAREILGGRTGVGCLAGLLFATHPILVEIVPAISRRQDILATVFLLLALLLHARSVRQGHGPRGRWPAAAAYALALGAKEIAAIFLIVVAAHAILLPGARGRPAARAFRLAAPYLAVTAAFVVWRAALFGTFGGIVETDWNPWLEARVVVRSVRASVCDLVLPGLVPLTPLRAWMCRSALLVSSLAAAALLPAALLWRRTARVRIDGRGPRLLARGALALGILALAGMAAAPWLAPVATGPAAGPAPTGSPGAAVAPARWPWLWGELGVVAAAALLAFAVVVAGPALRRRLERSELARWQLFYLVWFPPFVVVFVGAHTFAHRGMYLATVPFSVLLAMLIGDGWRAVRSRLAADRRWRVRLRRAAPALWRLAAPAGLAAYLLLLSPLLRGYPEWRQSVRLNDEFFAALEQQLPHLPPGAEVHVHGLPARLVPGPAGPPRTRSVSFPQDYTIKAWLDLHHPGNRISVVVEDPGVAPAGTTDLAIVPRFEGSRELHLSVRPERGATGRGAPGVSRTPSASAPRPFSAPASP